MSTSEVYRYPHYYALGYRWNTAVECKFIETCLRLYGPGGDDRAGGPTRGAWGGDQVPESAETPADRAGGPALRAGRRGSAGGQWPAGQRLLDIGCGAGRHLLTLAKQGYQMTGVDLHPEMVAYVEAEAKKARLAVTVRVDDLRALKVQGTFDAAYCFMDTFRFLLTNEAIIAHLRAVAERLAPGGLYLTDFWIPTRWDQLGGEIHQWEQTEGATTVRVFYLQHPESIDPVQQTFEDELVFEVQENGGTQTIRGGRTRTRLIMPQEFHALVEQSGAFDLLATHGDFDVTTPLDPASLSWRMVSILRKR